MKTELGDDLFEGEIEIPTEDCQGGNIKKRTKSRNIKKRTKNQKYKGY
jgi:hypothetical protein